MSEITTLSEALHKALEDIKARGVCDALGLEPRPPGRVVNPELCNCGGGCESPLECWFWYWLRKTELMERGAQRQVNIGRFRVDCLIDCDGEKVVVELDGKQWHQDKGADFRRDIELLDAVDAVIRIPGAVMHWYPEATFAVLATWYPRFELRARDMFCCSGEAFIQELQDAPHPDGDFQTQDSYLDWCEPRHEIYHVTGTVGYACSPKQFVNLTSWNVTPIVLRRACERDRQRPKPLRAIPSREVR